MDFTGESGTRDALQTFATSGYNSSMAASLSGSAWDGQMRSLQTDSFIHNQKQDTKNDTYTSITTTSHIMGLGGSICNQWTTVPLPGLGAGNNGVVSLSMAYLTGNTHAGESNPLNSYWLAKLKKFSIKFKDIIVALETSTSIGLQTMSDVTTEWRRRPSLRIAGQTLPGITIPDPNAYPDWYGDWRPATDGCVQFDFDFNGRELPTSMATARCSQNTSWTDPAAYRSLYQYAYGALIPAQWVVNGGGTGCAAGGDVMALSNSTTTNVCPQLIALPHHWIDYFFQWRSRNCPNSTSSANTSALYNIQIDAEWEVSYKLMINNPTLYRALTPGLNTCEKCNNKYDDFCHC